MPVGGGGYYDSGYSAPAYCEPSYSPPVSNISIFGGGGWSNDCAPPVIYNRNNCNASVQHHHEINRPVHFTPTAPIFSQPPTFRPIPTHGRGDSGHSEDEPHFEAPATSYPHERREVCPPLADSEGPGFGHLASLEPEGHVDL